MDHLYNCCIPFVWKYSEYYYLYYSCSDVDTSVHYIIVHLPRTQKLDRSVGSCFSAYGFQFGIHSRTTEYKMTCSCNMGNLNCNVYNDVI